MKAEQFPTPTPEELQEFYDLPSEISERDVCEYVEAERLLKEAREQFETCRANLEEMLTLGLPPAASSRLIPVLRDGKISIINRRSK